MSTNELYNFPTRFFTTTGAVKCHMHYCLPALERFDLDEIRMLIQQQKYFVLHAPRQTGKTTYLYALRDYLNQQMNFHCLYINVEVGQSARGRVDEGIQAVLATIVEDASTKLNDPYPSSIWVDLLKTYGPHSALKMLLSRWAKHSPQPLILMVDEIDALIGDTLISVLRQLRAGYNDRPERFPHTIILCGVRDVRDYRIFSDAEQAIVTGGSAFNIKATSLRLGNFTQDEIVTLYQQHTDETGQIFEAGVMEFVWDLTQGQPWLVNALAYEVCFDMKSGRDRSQAITKDMVIEAKEQLILRRETHIDQLVDKLREDRVKRVIEPIIAGSDETEAQISTDDVLYVRDLGLIRTEKPLRIANQMYQEIIPRELIFTTEYTIVQETVWYVAPDGRLDMHKLITAFQVFFRQNSEHWVERFDYKEAGPQLLLQAFLQRIVNGGGRIEREYGLGRKRTDLLVVWKTNDAVQKVVLELKILYLSREKTIAKGIVQTWEYMDKCDAQEGHLIIFDRSEKKPWEKKLFTQTEQYHGHTIVVWGM